MARPKKLEMTALLGLLVQGVFVLLCFILGRTSRSQAVGAEFWHMVPGVLVWFLVLMHGRQRRLAAQEHEESERLRSTRLSDEIFEETELDTMRASSGLRVFERYLVPFFSVVLSGLLLFFAYRVASESWPGKPTPVEGPQPVAVAVLLMAFFGFLMGKYATGLARNRGFRLLRAGGTYLLGNAVLCLLLALSMGFYIFDITWPERVLVIAIPCLMGLVGVELVLNLLLDIYRPRVEGREARPPYDSRLVGLLAEPGDVFRTVASTLDYQFGFKVSETWFYRFMARALAPLLLVWLGSLWLLSALVVVEQDEIAFIEVFGKPQLSGEDRAAGLRATVFYPGLHLKLPWPFAAARHVPAYEVHSVELGKTHVPQAGRASPHEGEVDLSANIILWSEEHLHKHEGTHISFLAPSVVDVEEESIAVGIAESLAAVPGAEVALPAAGEEAAPAKQRTPPVNLVRLSAWVHYRVRRSPDGSVDENAAFDYHYAETGVREHVELLAYRAICRIAASQDFLRWISDERDKTVREFRRLMEEAIEEAELGLELLAVSIPVVHPPLETAAAFEAVMAALQEKESMIHEAERQALVMMGNARSTAVRRRLDADAYAFNEKVLAEARAEEFAAQLTAYRKAPDVYIYRAHLAALERALKGQSILVVPVADDEVLVIDTQEKLQSDLTAGLGVTEEGQ